MRNKISKQEKERLDNKIVFFSSVTFLYALLLLFIQRMSANSMTVNGALAFIEILRWVALGGAMICAAWSAYKEKKGFFLYCAMCIYVFFSTTVIRYCTSRGSTRPYLINYGALAVVFVMAQIYYALKVRGKFDNKVVRGLFLGASALLIALFAAVSIYHRF